MARNRRLERLLRDAAIAEELSRRRVALHRERPRSPPEPNPYAALIPGFFIWERFAFNAMKDTAEVTILVFQGLLKVAQRT